MEGTIARATKDDLMNILNLQKKAFESVAIRENNFNIQPMNQTYENIVEEFGKRLFLKYTVDGVIVGSVRGHIDDNNVCHVGKLIVHPDYQNQGIGKALVKELEKNLNECDRYEIFTGENDQKVVGLYKRLGYIETFVKVVDNVSIVFLSKDNH